MTFEIVFNKSLKVFSELYVGVKPSEHGRTPLAFATPYETNAAGAKRQETVNTWTRGYYYGGTKPTETPDIRIIKNTPRTGFRITDDVKRTYWGGGNVVWRLHHPLGWEIEIQSNNLMALLQSVGVGPNGEIPGECVLARDGGHNIVLPIATAEYQNAIKSAEGAKAPGKIPMKDRVIGRFYRLQTGEYGQYLGKMYVRCAVRDYGDHGAAHTKIAAEFQGQKYFVAAKCQSTQVLNGLEAEQYELMYVPIEEKEAENGYKYTIGGTSKLFKSAALIEELDKGEITKAEAERIANENELSFATYKEHYPIYASFDQDMNIQPSYKVPAKELILITKANVMTRARTEEKRYLEYVSGKSPTYAIAKPVFTVNGMLGEYHSKLYLHDDGHPARVYASGSRVSRYVDHARWDSPARQRESVMLLGRVLFPTNQKQVLAPADHNPSVRPADTTSLWHDGMILPEYSTADDLERAIDELIAQDQFVTSTFKRIK